MPFTFLSHQAPVLPLKLAAPRWFDGTALVIGSTAPDLVFALHGTPYYLDAHAIWLRGWLCIPASVVLTWLVKRQIAGVLAPHLPDAGGFRLTDYQHLAAWPGLRGLRAWLVVTGSALLGYVSHLVLDSFTHGFGWATQRLVWLRIEVMLLPAGLSGRTVYLYDLLQVAATGIGAAITVACLHHIGRHDSLRRWYPSSVMSHPTARSHRWLWTATLAGVAAGVLTAILTRRVGGMQDLIIRVADLAFIGLLIGCAVARPAMRASPQAAHRRQRSSCRTR